jgi:hypothetical protein
MTPNVSLLTRWQTHIAPQIARIPLWLVTLVSVCVLTALPWFPWNYHLVGLVEEYVTFQDFETGRQSLAIIGQNNRIFTYWSFWLAHLITPNTFDGLFWLMCGFLVAKSMLLYGIVRVLAPQYLWVAYVAAVLLVVNPTNQMALYSRILNYHALVVTLLAAVYCLLLYWRTGARLWLIPMFVALLFSTATVETAFPLMAVAPLLLVYLNGGRLSKRVFGVTALWYVVPFVVGVWTILLYLGDAMRYGESITASLPLNAIWQLLLRAIAHSLLLSWYTPQVAVYWALGALAGLIALVGGLWMPFANTAGLAHQRRLLVFLLASLAVIVLGLVLYLGSRYHIAEYNYSFMISMLGVSVFWATLLTLVARRWVGVLGLVVLVGLGISGLAAQTQQMRTLSTATARLITEVVQTVPQPPAGIAVIFFDRRLPKEPNTTTQNDLMLFSANTHNLSLSDAFDWLYQNQQTQFAFCVNTTIYTPCVFEADRIHFSEHALLQLPTQFYPYDRIIAFNVYDGGRTELLQALPPEYTQGINTSAYNPTPLIEQAQGPLPTRWQTFYQASGLP